MEILWIQHLPEFEYFLKNFLEQNVSTCNWSIIHRLIENFKHRIKAGREAFLSFASNKMSNIDLVAARFKYTYFLMLPRGLLLCNDGTWVRINEIPTLSTKSDTQWNTNPSVIAGSHSLYHPWVYMETKNQNSIFWFFVRFSSIY